MEYFSGTATVSCDEKGRLRIPARYRSRFGDTSLYAFRNDENYLSIISKEKTDEIISKLGARMTMQDTASTAQVRRLLSNIEEIKEDTQGRFVLSQEIKENMGLEKEVVFVGVGTKLELWDKLKWEQFKKSINNDTNGSQLLTEISF